MLKCILHEEFCLSFAIGHVEVYPYSFCRLILRERYDFLLRKSGLGCDLLWG